jgi:hypothetical protein
MQPKECSHLGSNEEADGRLAAEASDPSPLAQPAFRRQTPEVRAVCINVHVRISAGGARQLASLPRLGASTPIPLLGQAGDYAALKFQELLLQRVDSSMVDPHDNKQCCGR